MSLLKKRESRSKKISTWKGTPIVTVNQTILVRDIVTEACALQIDMSFLDLSHLTVPNLIMHYQNAPESHFMAGDYRGSKIGRNIMDKSDMSLSFFDNSDMRKNIFSKSNFSKSSLVNCDLRGSILRGVDFTECDLRGADLRGCIVDGAIFYKTDLRGAKIDGVDFSGCDMNFVSVDINNKITIFNLN